MIVHNRAIQYQTDIKPLIDIDADSKVVCKAQATAITVHRQTCANSEEHT